MLASKQAANIPRSMKDADDINSIFEWKIENNVTAHRVAAQTLPKVFAAGAHAGKIG